MSFQTGETLLTQNLFFDRDKVFTKFSGEIFKFQSLSDDYLEDNLPFVRPVIVYSWNNLWDSKRDRINTYNLLNLNRFLKKIIIV